MIDYLSVSITLKDFQQLLIAISMFAGSKYGNQQSYKKH